MLPSRDQPCRSGQNYSFFFLGSSCSCSEVDTATVTVSAWTTTECSFFRWVLLHGEPPPRYPYHNSGSECHGFLLFLLVAHVSDPSFSPRPGLTQQGCAVRLCLSSMAELNNPLPHYRLAPSLALGIIGHLKKISSSSAILHVRTCSPDCKTLARKAFQPKTKSNSVSTCAGHL